MLRIDTNQDPSTNTHEPVVLSLSGQLMEATLSTLQPLVESARAAGREVELDLDGVVRADRAGAEYLARLSRAGVRLRRCPLSLRVWLRVPAASVSDDEAKPGNKPRRAPTSGCEGTGTEDLPVLEEGVRTRREDR